MAKKKIVTQSNIEPLTTIPFKGFKSELLEGTKIQSDTEMRFISITIYNNWSIEDFQNMLFLIKRITTLVYNIGNILTDKNKLATIYEWTIFKNRNFFLHDFKNYLLDTTYRGLNEIRESRIEDINDKLEKLFDNFSSFDNFDELDIFVNQYFLTPIPMFSYPISKIIYNSPGEIVAGVPKAIVESTNSIINTFLFYSKKKQLLELEIELKRAELEKTKSKKSLEDKNQLFKELEEQLAFQISIIKKFNELKKELIELGVSDSESDFFIKEYITSYFEQLFPTLQKIEEINLLKE